MCLGDSRPWSSSFRRPAQWNAREFSGPGPRSKRGLVNGDRRPIPRGRARSRKPAYFFFLAAFFFVAFFFAAFFFAISNHLLECFVPCDEIAFARRDTGGGRMVGGRGGTVASPERRAWPHRRTSTQRAISPNVVARRKLSACGNEGRILARRLNARRRGVDDAVENVANRQQTWRLRGT